MKKIKKTFFNWSSGKDASLALYYLLKDKNYDVSCLLTSINSHYNRISMHGIHRDLLEKQAKEIGIPLRTIELPQEPSMEIYEEIMNKKLNELKDEKFTISAFGDIFLEDLRTYREEKLNEKGFKACFPLWKKDTKELIKEFIHLGFKAIVVCIKSDLLDKSFVGRTLDESFVNDLPENVDVCGENGEFHTFCYDGPIFKNPIKFEIGKKKYTEYKAPKNEENQKNIGFWFCDLVAK